MGNNVNTGQVVEDYDRTITGLTPGTMGQQVSVETFTSTSDTDGKKYWASFDPYPYKVGSRKLVYLGILNGDGPMKGQKCVVKTSRRDVINEKEWTLEKTRTQIVREIARAFNGTVSDYDRKVCVNGPIIAEIDTLSDCMCLNDIIGKPKKKFKETDYVSIELYLKGEFEDFEYGWVSDKDLIVPEAFSHFSWCQSEGNMLVSNLQGVKRQDAYHFTGPVIHSDDRSYGNSDIGPDGIKGFFKLHKCNSVCRNWPRLGDGVDLRGWGTSTRIAINQSQPSRVPSAPPSPILPPYEHHHHSGLSNIEQQHGHVQSSQPVAPYQPGILDRTSPRLPIRNRHGMVIDWREEMMYQNMVLGRNRRPSPDFRDPQFDTQFMWVVKQMSYAYYNPPPPYCTPTYDVAAQRAVQCYRGQLDSGVGDGDEFDYYADEDDSKCLLPPPYSEQSVEPEYDRVTYL